MEKVKFIDAEVSKSIVELLSKLDHKTLALWAADCAEHVLLYFDENNPEDNRPYKAILAGRAWVRGEMTMVEARKAAFASHAAARVGKDAAACAAARSAGHAAATAHVADHAVHAAAYAAKAAAYASNVTDAIVNVEKERCWQFEHLLKLGDLDL